MKVIIIGAKACKELVVRIEKVERALASKKLPNTPPDDDWVDGKTVCRYLGISPRTLQRLRSDRVISYSSLNHKLYYTLGDIKRVLHERSVNRRKE
ncbi:helix-turn-helix domain-containing protein [uncultured Rikenella sp.]|uniref:helix-turn-helix domain-containing protein n=1 Tax=uncultured Rikenella sp. TaxID=368003 RepID=UPI0025E3A89F|nr:helix-turn-helix domain-containing protein [uncultured Rikenella sp.]